MFRTAGKWFGGVIGAAAGVVVVVGGLGVGGYKFLEHKTKDITSEDVGAAGVNAIERAVQIGEGIVRGGKKAATDGHNDILPSLGGVSSDFSGHASDRDLSPCEVEVIIRQDAASDECKDDTGYDGPSN